MFSAGVVGYALYASLSSSARGRFAADFELLSLRMSGSTPWDSREPLQLAEEVGRMTEVNFKERKFDHISQAGASRIRCAFLVNCIELNQDCRYRQARTLSACSCTPIPTFGQHLPKHFIIRYASHLAFFQRYVILTDPISFSVAQHSCDPSSSLPSSLAARQRQFPPRPSKPTHSSRRRGRVRGARALHHAHGNGAHARENTDGWRSQERKVKRRVEDLSSCCVRLVYL